MEIQEDFTTDEIMSVFKKLVEEKEYDLLRDMMVEIYYPDLLDLCATYSEVSGLCDDYLYQLKAKRDFSATELIYSDNWSEEYKILYEEYDLKDYDESYPLVDQFLKSRSLNNLRKTADYFGVKTTKLSKNRIVTRLLKDVPEDELVKEVSKYPQMKSWKGF